MVDTALFAGFALAYAALLVWAIGAAARSGWLTPANLPMLVLGGLVYDNLVLATGRYLGVEPLLETLNEGRFWLQALLTPLLVIWAWHAVARRGPRWARGPLAAAAAAAVAGCVALVLLELWTVTLPADLEPVREHGVLSYTDTNAGGPPIMVLVAAAVLLLAGTWLWAQQGWPCLADTSTARLGRWLPMNPSILVSVSRLRSGQMTRRVAR